MIIRVTYLTKKQNIFVRKNRSKITMVYMIVGIDLGTTNSCISIWRNNKLEVIPDKYGNNTIPSMIAFTKKSRYIGYEAKNQKELNPQNVFYEIKRLMGGMITDEIITKQCECLTYEVHCDEKDSLILKSEYGTYRPEELTALILMELKQMAQEYLKIEDIRAIITVPAYFTDKQRQATKDSAIIAGIDCVRIINEPTAAALAYGLGTKKESKVLVYDFGGGTLDISILSIDNGTFEVMASSGNINLGGSDFDKILIDYCMSQMKRESYCPIIKQKLKKECENAKKILSSMNKTYITIENEIIEMTREKYEELCSELLFLSLEPLDICIRSCDIEKDEIDEIILVGGATRMPAIRRNIATYFGKEPNTSVNPDEIVSSGAAILGYILANKDDPFSKSITLLDVTTLTLGVETMNGIMDPVILRNTIVPTTKKKMYTTISDNETSVTISVFEGERTLTKDNVLLGTFDLGGIKPMPRGYAKIEITFRIDSSGILEVTAEDIRESNSVTVRMTNKNRLSEKEIEELVEKAKQMELQDKIEKLIKAKSYELKDLIKVIKYNVNLPENNNKLGQDNINLILQDLEIDDSDFSEKNYDETIGRLKDKYFNLCFMPTDSDIKANDTTNIGTNIYDDNDEQSFVTITQPTQNDSLKNELTEMCINVIEIINDLGIEKEISDEYKYILDDIIIWVQCQEQIPENVYNEKIDQVNKICEKLIKEPGNELENELGNEPGNELGNEQEIKPGNEQDIELGNELKNETRNELEKEQGNDVSKCLT